MENEMPADLATLDGIVERLATQCWNPVPDRRPSIFACIDWLNSAAETQVHILPWEELSVGERLYYHDDKASYQRISSKVSTKPHSNPGIGTETETASRPQNVSSVTEPETLRDDLSSNGAASAQDLAK